MDVLLPYNVSPEVAYATHIAAKKSPSGTLILFKSLAPIFVVFTGFLPAYAYALLH